MHSAPFHGGLYRDTLRRLRAPSLCVLAVSLLAALSPFLFGQHADAVLGDTLFYKPVGFGETCRTLYYLPFVAAPLLALIALRYPMKKAESDFYFSLPLSKTAIAAAALVAVATWLTVITAVTAAVSAVCALATGASADGVDILLNIGGSLLASLFVTAVMFLASTLCGTTLTTLFTGVILLLGPRLIAYAVGTIVTAMCSFLAPDSATQLVDAISQNLLYGHYDAASVWVLTALKTVAVAALALWLAHRRPTERAEHPVIHPALHIVFRTLTGVLVSLPALERLLPYRAYLLDEALLVFLLALIAYYLYELITTRKATGLLHATKWLPLLIAADLAIVLLCQGTAAVINTAALTPDAVDGVSLTRIVYRESNLVFETGYGYDKDTDHDRFTTDNFYSLTRRYATESDAPQITLTDERSVALACDALARQPVGPYEWDQHGSTIHLYAQSDPPTVAFLVDIEYRCGWLSHTRRVALTDTELRRLLSRIKKQTALPTGMDLIFDNNLACPFDFESYYQNDLDGDGYVEGAYAFPPAVYGTE